jgi:hypothetical protein
VTGRLALEGADLRASSCIAESRQVDARQIALVGAIGALAAAL